MLIIFRLKAHENRDETKRKLEATRHKHPVHHFSAFLTVLLAWVLFSPPAVADDWLPPADSSATDSSGNDDAAEDLIPPENAAKEHPFMADTGSSSLRAWSDVYHEHGQKVRSSILGLSGSWSGSFGRQWQATANVDLDHTDIDPDTAGDTGWRLGLRELYMRHSAAD